MGPTREIVIAGDSGNTRPPEPWSGPCGRTFLPNKILLVKTTGAGRGPAGPGRPLCPRPWSRRRMAPQAYICEQYACRQPLAEAAALETYIKEIGGVKFSGEIRHDSNTPILRSTKFSIKMELKAFNLYLLLGRAGRLWAAGTADPLSDPHRIQDPPLAGQHRPGGFQWSHVKSDVRRADHSRRPNM